MLQSVNRTPLSLTVAVALGLVRCAGLARAGDPFLDPSAWTTFDPADNGIGMNTRGFSNPVLDGRYVYFSAIDGDNENLRYDTCMPFDSVASWDSFSPWRSAGGEQVAFTGAAVVGDYVYFVPLGLGCGAYNGEVARYSRNGAFADAGSWELFDCSEYGVGTEGTGFVGNAAFDGRYIYFPPWDVSSGCQNYSAEVRRYDTTLPFSEASSWSVFAPAGAKGGYFGAMYVDGYVYFSPFSDGTHGQVLRYDASANFTTQASWHMFDAGDNGVGNDPDGYGGLTFDGRFIYFAPSYNGATYHGEVLRYDSLGQFDSVSSWTTFDTTSVHSNARGFFGMPSFDGRYVYFAPLALGGGIMNRATTRYDTTLAFSDPQSWTVFEPAALPGYGGCVFDGRHVYFAPANQANPHGQVLRYDTVNAARLDCNANGIYDECDISNCTPGDRSCQDINSNAVPDECECPPFSAPASAPVAERLTTLPAQPVSVKNRLLSFAAGDAGASQALRVTFDDLTPPFDLWNGAQSWVGPPSEVSENAASVAPIEGNSNFYAAMLQCEPYYADWSAYDMLHVFHEGIVPGASYSIQVVSETCDLSSEASFSAPLVMDTAVFGDTVADLSVDPPQPPNGPPIDIVDALAILERFSNAPGAIVKARADLEPACLDLLINVSDVLMSLRGFAGLGYPFAPTAGDPCSSTCVNPLP